MKKIAQFFQRNKSEPSSQLQQNQQQLQQQQEAGGPPQLEYSIESYVHLDLPSREQDQAESLGQSTQVPQQQLIPENEEEEKSFNPNQQALHHFEQLVIGDHFDRQQKSDTVQAAIGNGTQQTSHQPVVESFNSAQSKAYTNDQSLAAKSNMQSFIDAEEAQMTSEESKVNKKKRASKRSVTLGATRLTTPGERPNEKASRNSGAFGQPGWTPLKRESSLSHQVKRQLNMETFRNIVQSKRRVVLSQTELEQLWVILRSYDLSHKYKDLQKPANHRRLWLKCSGALGQKLANPGYYDSLKRQGFFYPNPAFIQIELDLPRTYPMVTDASELKILLEPLRNVLYAIVIRNPTIGYCQGMNFIGARLLSCMREEEAFWTMSQILERYLPFDYYSNMIGVLVDQKVLQHFMLKRLPRLCEHLDNMQFSLDLIAFQWIACLFAINLPQNIHFVVWDLFFIKGIRVILRFALTILSLMEEEILAQEKFEDIYFLIDKFCQERLETKTLLEQFADTMSLKEIEDLRKEKRQEIMEVLKKQLESTQKNHQNQYPRLKFISNFQLYHGLSKFYQHVSKRSNNEEGKREGALTTLEQFEQDLMSIFDCDPSWPLCLYDFTHKNACPKFVTMRVQQKLDEFVIEDYWYSSNARTEANQLKEVVILSDRNEEESHAQIPFSELIIQRDCHVCQDHRQPNFVPYFKKRFQAKDMSLFQNSNLFFDIDDLLDAKCKIEAFMNSVSQPLDDEIFEEVERFQRRASMIALQSEVERVKGLQNQIFSDEQHIIGQHMEEEFDRALSFQHMETAQDHNPTLGIDFKKDHQQHIGQLDPFTPTKVLQDSSEQAANEDSKSPDIAPEQTESLPDRSAHSKRQIKRAETMALVGQSISNLQIAVRMTLLEQAIKQETKSQKGNSMSAHSDSNETNPHGPEPQASLTKSKTQESEELKVDNDQASVGSITQENAQKIQSENQDEDNVPYLEESVLDVDGVMEFATERDSLEDEEVQGTGSKEQKEPGLQQSSSAGNETSFFEDWGAPYQSMIQLKKDEKERLDLQMKLIKYKTLMDATIFDANEQEDPEDEKYDSDHEIESPAEAYIEQDDVDQKKPLSSVGSCELESCEESLKDDSGPEENLGTDVNVSDNDINIGAATEQLQISDNQFE